MKSINSKRYGREDLIELEPHDCVIVSIDYWIDVVAHFGKKKILLPAWQLLQVKDTKIESVYPTQYVLTSTYVIRNIFRMLTEHDNNNISFQITKNTRWVRFIKNKPDELYPTGYIETDSFSAIMTKAKYLLKDYNWLKDVFGLPESLLPKQSSILITPEIAKQILEEANTIAAQMEVDRLKAMLYTD